MYGGVGGRENYSIFPPTRLSTYWREALEEKSSRALLSKKLTLWYNMEYSEVYLIASKGMIVWSDRGEKKSKAGTIM